MRYIFLLLFCVLAYAQTPLETYKVWLDSAWVDSGGAFIEIRTLWKVDISDTTDQIFIDLRSDISDSITTATTQWRSDISDSVANYLLLSIIRDSINAYLGDSIGSQVQAYDAQLADIADGTLTGNFVNTAYPWADAEVANDITASSYLPLTAAGDSVEANAYYPGGTDVADGDVADNITASNYVLLTAVDDSIGAYSPPHGVFAFADSSVTLTMSESSWVAITNADNTLFTSEETSNITFAGDSVTINASMGGDFMINASISFAGTAADEYQFGVFKNKALVSTVVNVKTGGTAVQSVSVIWYEEGAAGDDFILKVRNTASADDATIHSCVFIIWRLHS